MCHTIQLGKMHQINMMASNKRRVRAVLRSEDSEDWVKALLPTPLLPHQRDGIGLMTNRLSQGKGAILMHEMGLGKTRQCAVSLSLYSLNRPPTALARPCVLVLAPVSVLHQWAKELALFKDALGVVFSDVSKVRACVSVRVCTC